MSWQEHVEISMAAVNLPIGFAMLLAGSHMGWWWFAGAMAWLYADVVRNDRMPRLLAVSTDWVLDRMFSRQHG